MAERTGLHTPNPQYPGAGHENKNGVFDEKRDKAEFPAKNSPKTPLGVSNPNTPNSSTKKTPQKDSKAGAAMAAAGGIPPPLPFGPSKEETKKILADAANIHAIGEKIDDKNIQLVYRPDPSTWVFGQPMPRSESKICLMLLRSPNKSLMGGVSCTPRGEKGFEIEYGKHRDYEGRGFGPVVIDRFLHELPHINQLGHFGIELSQIYAEVSSQGELNMPSYITLLKAGFMPVERENGDKIRWVHPDSNNPDHKKYEQILSAYKTLQNAKIPEEKKSAGEALEQVIETIVNHE